MRNYLNHIFIVLTVFSCGKVQKEVSKPILTFTSEITSAINEAEQYDSSVEDSTFTLRYESGEPRLTFKRSNGRLDSTLIEQYRSGLPKVEVNFEEGQLAFGQHGSYYDSLIIYFFATNEDTFSVETPIYKSYFHTNPNNRVVYERNYDSKGKPLDSRGDLILHSKSTNEHDSILLHFYIVNKPYLARYYDVERKFYLTTSDGVFNGTEININEEYSAAFVKLKKPETKVEVTGIAVFTDVAVIEKSERIMKDTINVEIE